MRVILIYSGQSKKFDSLAGTIFSTLQAGGHQVEKIRVEEAGRAPALFPMTLYLWAVPWRDSGEVNSLKNLTVSSESVQDCRVKKR